MDSEKNRDIQIHSWYWGSVQETIPESFNIQRSVLIALCCSINNCNWSAWNKGNLLTFVFCAQLYWVKGILEALDIVLNPHVMDCNACKARRSQVAYGLGLFTRVEHSWAEPESSGLVANATITYSKNAPLLDNLL
jgi:hypothetical protein